MASIIFNGRISDDGEKLFSVQSPGVLYGEGIFETMLVKDGRIFLEDLHWQRFRAGFEKLGLAPVNGLSMDSLRSAISELTAVNELEIAKVRVTAITNETGNTDLVIQTSPFAIATELNKTGLKSGIFSEARKHFDGLANLKHNNYLPYRMARKFALQAGWDEPIILNERNEVCEGGIYNIFIFSDGEIVTPPLSAGCIAGTLRQYLLSQYTIIERTVTVDEVFTADEILLTNSVQLMQWVESMGSKSFHNTRISALFQDFRRRNDWLFRM